ncbi:VCBS domain-containing protein [Ramlibacter sp. AN1015]|uniref:beta strand repeat-containing protein n=1 Tax=Ramlibacter sp. AN1015 TaxID=3133428 RepID=UPI0030C33837
MATSSTNTVNGVNTVSFSKTPQANGDSYLDYMAEDALEVGSCFYFDVMANDLGGKAKTLYSVDDGTGSTTEFMKDLTVSDTTNVATACDGRTAQGAELRIVDGKVQVRVDEAYLAKLRAMGAGEAFEDTFVYAIQLGNGTLAWAKVTFSITGANDAPVITGAAGAGTITEVTGTPAEEAEALEASGSIAFSDVDVTDVNEVSFVLTSVNGNTADLSAAVGTFSASVSGDTDATTAGSIDWAYSVAPAAVEYLAKGETLTLVYTVTLDDGNGGFDSQIVTVTITGTNDAPVITGAAGEGAITEVTGTPAEDAEALAASGLIAFSDVDVTDVNEVSFMLTSINGNTADLSAAVGTFSASVSGDTATSTAGNIDWAYSVAPAAVEYLAKGETLTLVYTVTLDDGNGGFVSQIVTVTITGTNDAPVIDGSSFTGTIAELGSNVDTGPIGITGTFEFDDADLSDTHTVGFTAVGTTLGTLTSLSISDVATGAGTGTVSWAYSVDASLVAYLAAGESRVEEFTVTVLDVHGTPLSDSAIVRVTITGTNDAPVLGADVAVQVDELGSNIDTGTIALNGVISLNDADTSDSHNVAVTASGSNAPGGAALGTLIPAVNATGDGVTWSYSVNAASVAYLAEGESRIETFTITVSDRATGGLTDTAQVQVTITGTNDAPVLGADVAVSANELGSNIDTGTIALNGVISLSDADTSDSHTVAVTASGSNAPGGAALGTLTPTVSATGDGVTWNYSVSAASVAYLAEGESRVETFTITVRDRATGGLTDTAQVQVTITGTNDAPVIDGELFSGTVAELGSNIDTGPIGATGTFEFADADLSDTHTVGFTAVGTTLGTLTSLSISDVATGDGTGTVSWAYSVDASLVAYLAAGESRVEEFTVTVLDVHGTPLSDSAIVRVTITGTNDAPVLGADVAVQVDELGSNIDTGTIALNGVISLNDADTSDSHNVAVTASGSNAPGGAALGTLIPAVNATGDGVTWSYSVNAASVAYLAEGESRIETFTITVSDRATGGLTDTAQVQVTITGTNDAPVLGADVAVSANELGSNIDTGTIALNGVISLSDADTSDSHTVAVTASGSNAPGGAALGTLTPTVSATGDGVTWNYSVSAASVAYLAEGESRVETFTITVRDRATGGLTDTAQVQVTITGTNDAPVLGADVAVSANELGSNVDTGTIDLNGVISLSDADTSDSHNVAVTASGSNAAGGVALGTLTPSITGEGVTWSYSVNAASVAYLAEGESRVETFTITVRDRATGGLTDTAQVQVTITGTNDAPVLGADVAVSANELGSNVDTGTIALNGVISLSDADTSDSHNVAVTASGSNAPGGVALGTLTPAVNATGDGVTWSYSVNAADVAYLAEGESRIETFTITVRDRTTGGLTDTAQVQVTITGTNDAPVISLHTGDSASSTLDENDAGLTASGTLTVRDADDSDTVTNAVTNVSVGGTYSGTSVPNSATLLGMMSVDGGAVDADSGDSSNIAWTFSSGSQAFDFLAEGETLTLTYTIVSDDGSETDDQQVTITISGTNDAPVIGGTFSGTVKEDTSVASDNITTSGALTIVDADTGQSNFIVQTASAGSNGFGTFTLDANGNWTYTASNSQAAIQQLSAGQSLTDSFTATSIDGTVAQVVTVTIFGTNDAPILDASRTPVLADVNASTGVPTGAVGSLVSSLVDFAMPSGQVDNVTDVDASAHLGVALTGTSGSGIWFYSLDNGTNWTAVGSVSDGAALLLAADANARVFFQSTTGGTGELLFRAWDQSFGDSGTRVSTAVNGGTTAFSAATDTATVRVNAAVTGSATIGMPTMSGNKTTVSITFSKPVDVSTISEVDFQFVYGSSSTTLTPQIESSIFSVGNTVLTVEFQGFTGNTSQTGTLTLLNSYQFADGSAGATTSRSTFQMYPAGAAGEPILLGLADQLPGQHVSSMIVHGVPEGWSINQGVRLCDGSWQIESPELGTLAITSLASFQGAIVVELVLSTVHFDGSHGTHILTSNIEAFPPGSPIFGWSGDDHLSGSSAADTFVIANPIGAHVIHHFDASADKVNLIAFGASSFVDLQAHLGEDGNGNAHITFGDGMTVTILGVSAAQLSAANFTFDEIPVLNNTGTMTLGTGSMLPFSGVVNNTGTISLESEGAYTLLQMMQQGVTLQGGGEVTLSDSDGNVIAGSVAEVTLTNIDNTISGAGRIGDGQLTLINQGTIAATGTQHALVIDTAGNVVVNSGLFAALGAAGLVVASATTGNGSALVGDGSTLTFAAATDADIDFGAGPGQGTLVLGQPAAFTGTITGLLGGDTIALSDVLFTGSSQVSYAAGPSGAGGTLMVSDGTNAAQFSVIGRYTEGDFQVVIGADGMARITSTATDHGTVLGTVGSDILAGTAGDDILVGGKGADILTGAAGSDTFVWRTGDFGGAVDSISDFTLGEGGDVLALGGLLPEAAGGDLSQFVRVESTETGTMVSIDASGSGESFQELVLLQGVTGIDLTTLAPHINAYPLA